MNRRLFVITFVFLLGVVSAFSVTFYNRYRWDVDPRAGLIWDGTSDAYDGMYRLKVNNWYFYGSYGHYIDNNRGWWIEAKYGNLKVIRYVYVPPSPEMWARFVVYVKNEGSSTTSVSILVYGNLGSDSRTKVWGTSDGDTVLETSDVWFGTDDKDGTWDPTLVHWMGYNLYSVRRSWDNLYFEWNIALDPGESATIVFWAIQAPNQDTAREIALDILEAIETGDRESKYFEHLFDEDKSFLLDNVINMPPQLFVKVPRLKIYKEINATELFTWEELGVRLTVNISWPKAVNTSVNYSFEKITIEDSFPTRFDFIGITEDGVRKIGLNIIKTWENGSVVVNDTFYVPISIEGDYYKFVLEPRDEFEDILKIVPNQTIRIEYIIIPKFAGKYTLPSAIMSYFLKEIIP